MIVLHICAQYFIHFLLLALCINVMKSWGTILKYNNSPSIRTQFKDKYQTLWVAMMGRIKEKEKENKKIKRGHT